MQNKKATILVILDGWGIAPPSRGNAISLAKTPVLDRLYEIYPSTTLGATGIDAGLPDGKTSGSEAGHMNIGAGRIVKQDETYIAQSIRNGSFFLNPVLVGAAKHVLKTGGNFHIMGLMGNDDSPHSNPEHFRAILRLAKKNGITEVFCHLFTDGRDSYPKSALAHLKKFRNIMVGESIGKIATLAGRFYAMDRAKNWDRLALAYEAIVFARGKAVKTAEEAIEKNYDRKLTDEYLEPAVIMEKDYPVAKVASGDAMIFFNLRSDRARQFSKLFVSIKKEKILKDDMSVIDKPKNFYFAAMTGFGPDLDVHTAFGEHHVESTLPMALGALRQLYLAESEKFSHMTYFLNGGYADPVGGEERIMIKSSVVNSFAKKPEMSAGAITQKVLECCQGGRRKYDFVALNFANADMVGHTGDIPAVVKAVEYLDKQLKILSKKVLEADGNLIITADHGNAEDMLDFKTDQPNTFHTKNPVPFLLVSKKFQNRKLRDGGILGNIAPTILDVMNIEKPKLMKERSLLK